MLALYDSHGNPVTVGDKIGEGGEGAVYHLPNHQHLVAKIYRQPASLERAEKLRHMIQQRTDLLSKHTAWPVALLYREPSRKDVVGLMMVKVATSQAIHQLYTPRSRRQAFPKADWRYLIHVAANTARAFASVHEHGHVIGDVNHGNVVVDQNGTVRLIDCDSFQISGDKKVFLCQVGVPDYTSPELHGRPLSKTLRTANHDCFGLAVLIFQLLVMGRHPYSGAYFGKGDMPLERAIKENRFAYGASAEAYHMRPPPNTLALSEISPTIEKLFERAFGSHHLAQPRPSAREWIAALTQLSESLCTCAINNTHVYSSAQSGCPWCRLESRGLTLFGAAPQTPIPETFNLNTLWNIVNSIEPPTQHHFPKHVPLIPTPQLDRARWHSIGNRILVLLALLSTISFVSLLVWWSQWLIALLIASIGLIGVWRIQSLNSSSLAAWYIRYARAYKAYAQLASEWQREADLSKFTHKVKEAERAKTEYTSLLQQREERMRNLRQQLRERQLYYFLNSYRIENSHLDGIGNDRRAALLGAGVETAADITMEVIGKIPGFGPQLCDKLCAWRAELEGSFRFDPNRGVDPRDIRALDQEFGPVQRQWQHVLESAPKNLLKAKEEIEQAQAHLLPRVNTTMQMLTNLSTAYPSLPEAN